VGRIEIDKTEANNLKTFKILNIKHTIEGLTAQGNFAFQLGQVNGKIKMHADGSEHEISSRYMASWKKGENGTWKIHYFIYYP
jgi:ketosteroid isomerase-like protein